MESVEDRLQRLEYHHRVLMKVLDSNEYPLYRLFIERKLTEKEVHELFMLCDQLQKKYKEQKEWGFVNFFPLLIQFAGLLTTKLHPDETMEALIEQKLYEELMKELKTLRYNYND
ncbi:DUF1878 family protein [Bacillus solimangrovi]|uniref:DUF1878 domain-containing protein n=1 Tax=Bacillus solimangrovi TaxID=1305675 RepID=A0A1E5LCA6_9BACI|nr:DUF1878 family protein [Bacillus solimangrovi]OEH91716.1 hypothetical protein BFG57_17940 [Bacillus solimangrovi]